MGGSRTVTLACAALTSTLLMACDVEVSGNRRPDGDLDIRTPIGALSVRSEMANDTGIPVFPGAIPLRDRKNGDRASVKINTAIFGFEVQAVRFETTAAPDQVTAFYRREMPAFGDVVECRGDIDFEGRRGRRRPVCDEAPGGREVQLVAGNEDTFRTIAIKPRGDGSEFALVYIDSRVGH